MKYLLMIYDEETESSADSRAATRAEYDQFNATYGARGVLSGGAELEPTDTATSVRVRNGETMLTDGPFAETREQLAGYYVVECDTLDEALEIAASIPGARTGTIEVRPQVEGIGPSET
ncbi:MAG TPA: YciI family protein [Gaiellaceae bacterium]